jgi:hypothetical protein
MTTEPFNLEDHVREGVPLPNYTRGQDTWPTLWRLPVDEMCEGYQNMADKLAVLVDDLCLREAIHVWDNCLRVDTTENRAGISAGILSAHARFTLEFMAPEQDLEEVAEAMKQGWLGLAMQARTVRDADTWSALLPAQEETDG